MYLGSSLLSRENGRRVHYTNLRVSRAESFRTSRFRSVRYPLQARTTVHDSRKNVLPVVVTRRRRSDNNTIRSPGESCSVLVWWVRSKRTPPSRCRRWRSTWPVPLCPTNIPTRWAEPICRTARTWDPDRPRWVPTSVCRPPNRLTVFSEKQITRYIYMCIRTIFVVSRLGFKQSTPEQLVPVPGNSTTRIDVFLKFSFSATVRPTAYWTSLFRINYT